MVAASWCRVLFRLSLTPGHTESLVQSAQYLSLIWRFTFQQDPNSQLVKVLEWIRQNPDVNPINHLGRACLVVSLYPDRVWEDNAKCRYQTRRLEALIAAKATVTEKRVWKFCQWNSLVFPKMSKMLFSLRHSGFDCSLSLRLALTLFLTWGYVGLCTSMLWVDG